MNQIITIATAKIGDNSVQTVNARDLHTFLEVGKDYSTWLKDRISQYGFVENTDYLCSPILGSEGRGGQNRVDHHITTDMAKELSMVERNAKGKEARQYFIECERVAQAVPIAAPAVTMHPAVQSGYITGDMYKHFKESGLDDTKALSMASVAAYRATGIALVEFMQIATAKVKVVESSASTQQEQLPLPLTSVQSNKKLYYVYELANMFGRSIAGTNCLLTRRKYQERRHNGRYYLLKAGEKFGAIDANGELMWKNDVLEAR